ncbi:MAG: helix-turn-helix transcriptional regulator [Acidobacteriota bacterium]
MDEIREQLKAYMGEKDLTVADVAKRLGRNPLTIWKFLRGKTKPHDQTMYRIKQLVERG